MTNTSRSGIRLDARAIRLLSEAHDWHLLGRLLERPRARWRDDVRRLADVTADDGLRRAAREAAEASEGRYLAAFGPSGTISPREVAHCGMRDPGQLLAEIEACYTAFGFAPAVEDTVDHFAVEVSFLAYLRLKEAYARARGVTGEAAITADAARRFADDHLRAMARPVADRLDGTAEPYLSFAARAVADRVGAPASAAKQKIVWLDDQSWHCGGAQPQ